MTKRLRMRRQSDSPPGAVGSESPPAQASGQRAKSAAEPPAAKIRANSRRLGGAGVLLMVEPRPIIVVQKESPPFGGLCEIIPAVTYSPTQLPTQYHRR